MMDQFDMERSVADVEDLYNEIRDLKAQIEWRPIATAPKDGTRILIFDTGSVYIAYWSERANFGGGDADDKPGWQIFYVDGDEYYSIATTNATHWMPLPKAP